MDKYEPKPCPQLSPEEEAEIRRLAELPEYQRVKNVGYWRREEITVPNYRAIARAVNHSNHAVKYVLDPSYCERRRLNQRWNYWIDDELRSRRIENTRRWRESERGKKLARESRQEYRRSEAGRRKRVVSLRARNLRNYRRCQSGVKALGIVFSTLDSLLEE